LSFTKTDNKTNLKTEHVLKKEPERTHSYNGALGSTGGYTLKSHKGYFKPQILNSLRENRRWDRSPPEKIVVDERPSEFLYYDGSDRLNSVRVDCLIYANKEDCLSKSNCGWCGSRNCCIGGNRNGPIQSCERSTYIFSYPLQNLIVRNEGLQSLLKKPINLDVIKTLARN